MNFIARLMPREGRFFVLFEGHAKLIVDGRTLSATCCGTTRTKQIGRRA
jgi:hypothetical protein